MRRSLPYDAAICLCLAALIAWGVGILTQKVAESSWERQKEKLAPESREVGGIAGKEVFRVETVEDMLSHDTFTIECPYHNFYNDGTGWVRFFGGQSSAKVYMIKERKKRWQSWIKAVSRVIIHSMGTAVRWP